MDGDWNRYLYIYNSNGLRSGDSCSQAMTQQRPACLLSDSSGHGSNSLEFLTEPGYAVTVLDLIGASLEIMNCPTNYLVAKNGLKTMEVMRRRSQDYKNHILGRVTPELLPLLGALYGSHAFE